MLPARSPCLAATQSRLRSLGPRPGPAQTGRSFFIAAAPPALPGRSRPSRQRLFVTAAGSAAAAAGALAVPSMPSLLAIGAGALVLWGVVKLVQLAFADADLHLLSKGKAPANAWQGKVIWVTGASQVLQGGMGCRAWQGQQEPCMGQRSTDELHATCFLTRTTFRAWARCCASTLPRGAPSSSCPRAMPQSWRWGHVQGGSAGPKGPSLIS